MNLDTIQWVAALVAALLVGLSKTGINGLGLLCVVIFASLFPSAKQASGLVLPLLLVGDAYAVVVYRRHAQWRLLWRLFPWTAAGVVAGFWALGRMSDSQARTVIGALVAGLVGYQLWQRWRGSHREQSEAAPATWLAPAIGMLAGFTTLVANAAGPLMALYLLAMRLPKYEFVGTGAVFFLVLNWFKVPFMAGLGLITFESLRFNLLLAPAVVVGAWAGKRLLQGLDQRWFERLALGLSGLAGVNLLATGAGWW